MRVPFGPSRAGIRRGVAGACLALGAGSLAPPAAAQDDPGGLRLLFDIEHRLEYDSNAELRLDDPGRTVSASTRLGFGLASETRRQSLSLTASALARAFDSPLRTDNFRLGEPRVELDYERVASRAVFTASALYQRTDILFQRPLDEFLEEDDDGEIVIILPGDVEDLVGEGTRERLELDLGLELGVDLPLGLILDAGYTETNFEDATADNLNDTRRGEVSAETRLTFSPVTEGTVTLSRERFEADDDNDTRRDTTRLIFGVTHEFSRRLALAADLGPVRVTTRGDGPTETEDGVDGSLQLSYDLPTGSVEFNMFAETNQDGIRTQAGVVRRIERPLWVLRAGIGVARSPASDSSLTAGLDFRRELPRGDFGLRFERDVVTRIDDENRLRSLARADYNYNINNISGIELDATFGRFEDQDGSNRVERMTLGATYRRAVTAEWNMNLGYRYRAREFMAGDADSHLVFLSLGRDFDFGL